tara:strand:- start:585 stop:1649 length:1065 start_codon:yes stop_codon:yes gene_type:complete
MIFKSDFLRNINFFFYKKKHLILYTAIGFLSLIFELYIRKQIKLYISSNELFLHTSLIFGILFAFYFNIKFNFNVPKIYLKKSLIYFCLISICSYLLQYFFRNQIKLSNYSFEEARILISGGFFLIAYFFHTKFSFKDTRKVGVAIYANGYEDIKKIFNSIGPYPDFIHVDIVDQTMNQDALDPNLSKLEVVKAYWPNHLIETHIMSTDPLKLINKNILYFSDIIYVHNEIKNKDKVINIIKEKKKIPGIVLHSIFDYPDIESCLKGFEQILILSIEKPGISGQEFNEKSYKLIERINNLQNRNRFSLCVDGGVKSKIINKFISEKVVSGSDVLNSQHPIRKIMMLQTVARYEK